MDALIDFDGTLVKQVRAKRSIPTDFIGEPIAENIKKLKKLKEEGYKIIIFTGRIDPALGELAAHQQTILSEWLHKNNIPFDGFYAKPYQTALIADDISEVW